MRQAGGVDYGRPLEFGISVAPLAVELETIELTVRMADAAGLDLVGIQDHPYQWRFVDTWTLIAWLAARTGQIRFFPDVANLPLRPPAVLAKAVASLDVLTGGRVELGLGAGAFWEAIGAMGGPVRTAGESVEALEEAIGIARLMWSGERTIAFDGRYYAVKGVHPGPEPAHPISIWLGAYRPRMLRLTGRLADGWVPSLGRTSPGELTDAATTVDEAAAAAGRDPASLQRLLNVSGAIDAPADGLSGSVSDWIDALAGLATAVGFDTFVFWPADGAPEQVERFAADVVPGVRAAVERERATA
jgi:alkanesulfonate monooxygenase SsuD/methylene tetrahydromethanopterin reductase-like flavin-dependent oxidoreductase (luciferase family)